MTSDEMHVIAREAAREAIIEVLATFGIDRNPIEAQADMAFIRAQRRVADKIGVGVKLAFIAGIVSGLLAVIWLGVKAALN